MKACSCGSAMWSGWRLIGLPRVNEGECAGSHSVDRLWKRWIDTVKVFQEKRFGCHASKENGAG